MSTACRHRLAAIEGASAEDKEYKRFLLLCPCLVKMPRKEHASSRTLDSTDASFCPGAEAEITFSSRC